VCKGWLALRNRCSRCPARCCHFSDCLSGRGSAWCFQNCYSIGKHKHHYSWERSLGVHPHPLCSLMPNRRIRKLAADVSVSIHIDSKELLQTTLMELNSLVLDFGDKMIELRSTTINSATFIVHEVQISTSMVENVQLLITIVSHGSERVGCKTTKSLD